VVDDVSLELSAGEFFCLLGPSGSGKSTLLRLIGGYRAPNAGRVWMHGREITSLAPEKRKMGMVFQNYALFPHLNAWQNVAFGLRVQRVSKPEREAKAREMLGWVGLTSDEFGRLPAQLSGGQQQRVALARALAFGPDLLMLDEPFANLDRTLRERLRDELREVQQRLGITTILVTHDRDEALALGDRIAMLHQGRLLQIGTPEEVYRQPCDVTVARFLGHRNVLETAAARLCGLDECVLLWPDKLRLREDGGLSGAVRRITFAGSHSVVLLRLDGGPELHVHAAHDSGYRVGQRVGLTIPPEAITRIKEADL
jgi:ABC-type Fe3+/spermidine/putrescine transport system ATPase subunit